MKIGFVERDGCPLCDARHARLLVELSYGDSRLRSFIERFYQGRAPLDQLAGHYYRVLQCDRCGFIYQDPILDRAGMESLYEDWVDQAQSLQKKQQKQGRLARQYRGQLLTISRLLRRAPERIEILEFGMGWGYWSMQAKTLGFRVSGLELSQRRRAHAVSLGVDTIDRLPAAAAYDCIYANQVFEHLPDPLSSLRELAENLAPGGVIHLRVPDGRGIAGTLAQQGWLPALEPIHPLEHVNCFTRKTLIRLGESCGLAIVNPPPRLTLSRLWGGVKREIADRFLTTHLFFRRP